MKIKMKIKWHGKVKLSPFVPVLQPESMYK